MDLQEFKKFLTSSNKKKGNWIIPLSFTEPYKFPLTINEKYIIPLTVTNFKEEDDQVAKHTIIHTNKVSRIEVIDENGRQYVRGGKYGTPIKLDLSVQDDGETLKIFVANKE